MAGLDLSQRTVWRALREADFWEMGRSFALSLGRYVDEAAFWSPHTELLI